MTERSSSALLANSGDPLTFQMVPVIGNGSYQGSQLQGGFRFQRIVLNLPGTITLTNIATELTAPLRSPEEYAGNFLSSMTRSTESGTPGPTRSTSTRFPPAHRDSQDHAAVHPGGGCQTRPRSLGRGPPQRGGDRTRRARRRGRRPAVILQIISDNPVKAFVLEPLSLPFAVPTTLSDPGPAAGVCSGVSSGGCEFWGASYSMALAQNMGNYYKITGDTEFVRDNWAAVQRAVTYGNSADQSGDRSGRRPADGQSGLEWSGRAVGQVASTNMIQYNSLTSAAVLAEAHR